MIDDGCWAVAGMRIGSGNRSTRMKPAPVPLCQPHIPHDFVCARTRAAAAGSRLLTAWAMARSVSLLTLKINKTTHPHKLRIIIISINSKYKTSHLEKRVQTTVSVSFKLTFLKTVVHSTYKSRLPSLRVRSTKPLMIRTSYCKNLTAIWDYRPPHVAIALTIELLKSKATKILIPGKTCAIGWIKIAICSQEDDLRSDLIRLNWNKTYFPSGKIFSVPNLYRQLSWRIHSRCAIHKVI
jgi:hypothetical protein